MSRHYPGVTVRTLFYYAARHGWKPPARNTNIEVLPAQYDDAVYIIECAANGERGDAELFALLGRNEYVYDHSAETWRRYADGIWVIDEVNVTRLRAREMITAAYLKLAKQRDDEITADLQAGKLLPEDLKTDPRARERNLLRTKAAKLNKRNYIDDVVDLASDFLAVKASDFDRHGDLINLANGTLNLETLILHDHSWSDLLTKRAEVAYDAQATCPRFREFMNTVMGGDADLVAFVQRALGYSITTDVSADAVFFCYGAGGNGKSTLFEVIRRIMGSYFTQLPIEALLSQNRGNRDNTGSAEVANLKGARLALSSEIPEGRQLNEATVKDLTGGDMITARRLYGHPFSFEPTQKNWMFGNHQPVINGQDEGIWRRIYLIPFGHQFPKNGEPGWRDRKDVLVELAAEGPGILHWLLEGLQEYYEQGLNPPAVVRQATERYRSESDTLNDFLEECCIKDPQATTGSRRLYKAYISFSLGRSAYASQKAFSTGLAKHGYKLVRGRAGERSIKGLRLRPDADVLDEMEKNDHR